MHGSFAVGDGQLPVLNISNPLRIRGRGRAESNDSKTGHFQRCISGFLSRLLQLFKVTENQRLHPTLDSAVLDVEIKHECRGALRSHAKIVAKREPFLEQPRRVFRLDILEFLLAAESLELALPGLEYYVFYRVLNGTGPRELFVARLREHGHQRRIVGDEDLSQNIRVVPVHFFEERLQAPLANIPLNHSKADSLPVEVSRQSGKTLGRRVIGFEGSRKSQTNRLFRPVSTLESADKCERQTPCRLQKSHRAARSNIGVRPVAAEFAILPVPEIQEDRPS